MTGRIAIGTSGWSYDHWSGTFYPEHLRPAERLAYYAERFPTVEINATFYRLPSEAAVRAWREAAPEGFRFAVKGSRYITHFRQLAEVDEQIATFMSRLSGLGESLSVVLWQLPPNLKRDDRLLESFLGRLPDSTRHAVEFRDESWIDDGVFRILRRHEVAHASVSSDRMHADLTPTADFVYTRFHGTAEYHGAYREPALRPWAKFLREQAEAGQAGFAFFNNDAEGHAPHDAQRLMRMLGDYALPAPGRIARA